MKRDRLYLVWALFFAAGCYGLTYAKFGRLWVLALLLTAQAYADSTDVSTWNPDTGPYVIGIDIGVGHYGSSFDAPGTGVDVSELDSAITRFAASVTLAASPSVSLWFGAQLPNTVKDVAAVTGLERTDTYFGGGIRFFLARRKK